MVFYMAFYKLQKIRIVQVNIKAQTAIRNGYYSRASKKEKTGKMEEIIASWTDLNFIIHHKHMKSLTH